MKEYLALDIGGTNVKYGIVNEIGEVVKKGVYDTVVETEEKFIGDIINVFNQYKNKNLEGLAISMPGFIDGKNGIPSVCYAINVMEGKEMKKILEEKTGIRVEVENDGKCVALAEKFTGNAIECSDFICLTIGTGIGGGIFLNNKLIRGNTFSAGEFGFMINRDITKDNEDFQTFSENSSTNSLIRRYKKYKNIDDNIIVEGKEVFENAKVDKNIEVIIKDWLKSLALGIFNLSATLNPEKILIGGGISSKEGIVEDILGELNNIKYWNDVKCKIELCKHKNDAGLIGAVYNFCNR